MGRQVMFGTAVGRISRPLIWKEIKKNLWHALDGNDIANAEIIEDREEAICLALQYLNKENILVILGKGHETHMEVSGKKIPFNDKDCVLKILSNEIN